MEFKDAIPVTILTGFLGAGKTTLLNRILSGHHGLRVAVLVNDFGAINIDADLVVGVKDDMISLANGCVCCQIRDDLVESVEGLLDRPESVEYIDHAKAFSTWSFQTNEPLSLDALRKMVKRDMPASVYRCKGLIQIAEHPGQQAVLQCVGRRTDVALGDGWGDRIPTTQIVAIGVPGEMAADELQMLFDGCIAGRQRGEPAETCNGLTTVRI